MKKKKQTAAMITAKPKILIQIYFVTILKMPDSMIGNDWTIIPKPDQQLQH